MRAVALTIASDKGHDKFVKLLLSKGAVVDARNKKGCTSLWLACNNGHLSTVQRLVNAGADLDACDNRKVTPLFAAFKKGYLNITEFFVGKVTQFPSDVDCSKYVQTVQARVSDAAVH